MHYALWLAYRWTIHLRTMSDGEPHPAARTQVLSYTFATRFGGDLWVLESSITSSRLALLGEEATGKFVTQRQLIIWNWITGEMLLVCQLFLGDRTLMWTVHSGNRNLDLPVCTVC